MGTLHENFPSYQKTDENFVLNLGGSGHWEITATEDVAYALIQSRTKSMIAPPNNHLWQYRSSSSTWLDDPSFTIQPLVYPEAYCLKYSGNNETVEDFLDTNYLQGTYKQDNLLNNNLPVFIRDDRPHYLFQSDDNQWTVSAYLRDKNSYLMYQDRTKEPAPTEDAFWRIKLNGLFVETNDINLMRCDEQGNRLVVNFPSPKSLDTENEGKKIVFYG